MMYDVNDMFMNLVLKGVDIICMCIYILLTSMIVVISMIFKWYDLYSFLVHLILR